MTEHAEPQELSVARFDPLELRDLRYRDARLRAWRAKREWELRHAGMSRRQARAFARYETEGLAMASDVVFMETEADPTRDALTEEEAAFADRLLLTRADRALFAQIRNEDTGHDPWFVLGLEKGWLRGDVAMPGTYTWQGALILGIEPGTEPEAY